MARVRLRDIPITPTFRGTARLNGTFYVYYPGTTTEAVVSDAATGGSAITQPLTYSDYVNLNGWVEAGEYTFSANSYTQHVEAGAGDALSGSIPTSPMSDDALSCMNFAPHQRNSVAATATSQTVRLIRIVPRAKIVAATRSNTTHVRG